MRLLLANSLDGHHLGLFSLIALTAFLIFIAGAMAAGGGGVCYILQSPLFPVVDEFHERISMVSWGISSMTTPPLFYLPRREWLLHERYVGLREQCLHQVGLPGFRNVAAQEGVVLEQLLVL